MKSVKLPPESCTPRGRMFEPACFSGPLAECVRRNQPANEAEFTRRWYRAQMRGWAGHWRAARAEAALVGRPVEVVAKTALDLAVVYREAGRSGRC